MRESRRQNNLPAGDVPEVCLLDPDGDLFRHLKTMGAERNPRWACYHSEMMNLILGGRTIGVIGSVVGASVCRSCCRATLCFRMPTPDQRDLRRANRICWTTTLFRADRTCLA